MKIIGVGDLNIDPDVLKNKNDYVWISGKYYHKTKDNLVNTSNGWQIYNENDFVLDCIDNKQTLKKEANSLIFIDKKGKKKELFFKNYDNLFYKTNLCYEIFHDINFIDDYKKQINSRVQTGIYLSSLTNAIFNVESNKKVNTYIRLDQAKQLGFTQSLRNAYVITKKKEPSDIPISGNYIKGRSRKYERNFGNLNTIAKDNLTFGVEIETSEGSIIPDQFTLRNTDVSIERDGSISGGEYVTGILNKDEGFYDLYKIVDLISERCNANIGCGIHVHIGNTIFNKNFINLAYILGYKIQDELFTFLHKSRSNNLMCGKLLKSHYTVGVKSYKTFNKKTANTFFYKYLYDKMLYDKQFIGDLFNKKQQHPGKRYCSRYQQFSGKITPEQFRYKWLNLIPCNFNQRGIPINKNKKSDYPFKYLTLEFRPYQATLDYQEIEDWVLFCKSFVKYIINHSYRIIDKNVTIKDIILDSYDISLYDRMLNRKKIIGRKTTYPSNLTFSKFLSHRNKKNNIKNVSNNIQEINI